MSRGDGPTPVDPTPGSGVGWFVWLLAVIASPMPVLSELDQIHGISNSSFWWGGIILVAGSVFAAWWREWSFPSNHKEVDVGEIIFLSILLVCGGAALALAVGFVGCATKVMGRL